MDKNKLKSKNPYNLDFYLDQDYSFLFAPDEDGGYVGKVMELPGCITQGETIEETIEGLKDACECWIRSAYEENIEIPLPRSNYGGKITLRMPPSLHRDLAQSAISEGVSLNSYINNLLAREDALNRVMVSLNRITKQSSNSIEQRKAIGSKSWEEIDKKTLRKELIEALLTEELEEN